MGVLAAPSNPPPPKKKATAGPSTSLGLIPGVAAVHLHWLSCCDTADFPNTYCNEDKLTEEYSLNQEKGKASQRKSGVTAYRSCGPRAGPGNVDRGPEIYAPGATARARPRPPSQHPHAYRVTGTPIFKARLCYRYEHIAGMICSDLLWPLPNRQSCIAQASRTSPSPQFSTSVRPCAARSEPKGRSESVRVRDITRLVT